MDSNISQEVSSQNSALSQQTPEQQNMPKSSRLPLVLIILCIFIVVTATLGIIFHKQNKSQEQQSINNIPTAANQQHSTSVNISPTKTITSAPLVTSTPIGSTMVLPTTNPTEIANWKLASDKTNGFSFRFPSDWIEASNDPYSVPDGGDYHFTSTDFSTEKGQGGSYIVKVLTGMQLSILVQKADQYNPIPSGPADYFSAYKDVFSNNVKFHVSLNYNNLGRIAQADVIAYGKRYTIYLDSSQNEDTLFYQILSTFTFFPSQ